MTVDFTLLQSDPQISLAHTALQTLQQNSATGPAYPGHLMVLLGEAAAHLRETDPALYRDIVIELHYIYRGSITIPAAAAEADTWGTAEEYEHTGAINDQLRQIADEILLSLGEDINRGCGDTCGEADFEFV